MTNYRYQLSFPPRTDYYRKMVKCQSACRYKLSPCLRDSGGAGRVGEKVIRSHMTPTRFQRSVSYLRAPCEIACRRGSVGPDFDPVAIRSLKRVLTERYGPETAGHLPGISATGGDVAPLKSIRARDSLCSGKERNGHSRIGSKS